MNSTTYYYDKCCTNKLKIIKSSRKVQEAEEILVKEEVF